MRIDQIKLSIAILIGALLFKAGWAYCSPLNENQSATVELSPSGNFLHSSSGPFYCVNDKAKPFLNLGGGLSLINGGYYLVEFGKHLTNQSTGKLSFMGFIGTTSIQSIYTFQYVTQLYSDSLAKVGLKGNFSLDFVQFKEKAEAFIARGNVLFGKNMGRLNVFIGARFPFFYLLNRNDFILTGTALSTYGYVGAEYVVHDAVALYFDYYSNSLSIGISVQGFPIKFSVDQERKFIFNFGHPFWYF